MLSAQPLVAKTLGLFVENIKFLTPWQTFHKLNIYALFCFVFFRGGSKERCRRFVIREKPVRHWPIIICEFAFFFVSAWPEFNKELSCSHSTLVPFQLCSSMMKMHYCHAKCTSTALFFITLKWELLICIFPVNVTIYMFHFYFSLWLISYDFSWQLRLSFRRWETVYNNKTQLHLSNWFLHLSVLPG